MVIDLTRLVSGVDDLVLINSSISFDKDLYNQIEIKDLVNVVVNGSIKKDNSELLVLDAVISGTMILNDSISLDEIEYPFSIKFVEQIEEFEEKIGNSLDITDILWQNIVLEVPLKLTNVEDFNEYQGDGWKLVSEDSLQTTRNPFNELKDLMGEE